MITRFPGLTPTRSRAVVHDDLVMTVAVAPDPVTSSMYEQTAKALARIDESLALCGTDKSRILATIIYLADITQKGEFNRACDEWVDADNPPMRACIGVALESPHVVRSWSRRPDDGSSSHFLTLEHHVAGNEQYDRSGNQSDQLRPRNHETFRKRQRRPHYGTAQLVKEHRPERAGGRR